MLKNNKFSDLNYSTCCDADNFLCEMDVAMENLHKKDGFFAGHVAGHKKVCAGAPINNISDSTSHLALLITYN